MKVSFEETYGPPQLSVAAYFEDYDLDDPIALGGSKREAESELYEMTGKPRPLRVWLYDLRYLRPDWKKLGSWALAILVSVGFWALIGYVVLEVLR